ncbi:MAG: hypothetical protein ACLRWQ_01760, partial [Flavonifractor plautii]
RLIGKHDRIRTFYHWADRRASSGRRIYGGLTIITPRSVRLIAYGEEGALPRPAAPVDMACLCVQASRIINDAAFPEEAAPLERYRLLAGTGGLSDGDYAALRRSGWPMSSPSPASVSSCGAGGR